MGGALGLAFGEKVTVNRIGMTPSAAVEMPKRCLVMYTGESRISGNTITAVLNAYGAGDPRVRNALGRMRDLAEEMARALARAAFDDLGALVGEHWQHQRSLDPAIPTPLIDSMIDRAM